MNGLSLKQYVTLSTKLIDRFYIHWDDMSGQYPNDYPESMEIDEWNEQFAAYVSVHEKHCFGETR